MDESTETIRVHVKVSWLEMEYEGAPSHIRDHVIELVDRIVNTPHEGAAVAPVESELEPRLGSKQIPRDLSTSTVAYKLSAQTGADLAIAASAKLLFVDGSEQFSRKDILSEMRQAPAFFKSTYSNNLTRSLEGLLKSDRLRLTGPETYSISANEKERLRTKLAE